MNVTRPLASVVWMPRRNLAELHDEVVGELAVSAPVAFAAVHLVKAMQPLLAAYPHLTLRFVVTDDHLDLAREHIDLAIMIGTKPPASSLVRKHLATWENVLVASPLYLKRQGTPRAPEDLAHHAFISLPPWHHGGDALVGPAGARHRFAPTPRVVTNNQLTIRQLTLAACGLSYQRRSGNRRRPAARAARAGATEMVGAAAERGCVDAPARDAARQSTAGGGRPGHLPRGAVVIA